VSGKVGPGNPPESGRFKKKQSGNPDGRRRKKKEPEGAASAFEIIFDRTVPTIRDGRERQLTAEEALQWRTYKDAIAGDRVAQRTIMKMALKREKFLAKRRKQKLPDAEARFEMEDPTNAHDAMLLLGIASPTTKWGNSPEDDYVRLLLEPWAVQAALSRRRGGNRLTAREIADIKRSTRDPETLRWPRGTEDEQG
jgi:hypothetical protein